MEKAIRHAKDRTRYSITTSLQKGNVTEACRNRIGYPPTYQNILNHRKAKDGDHVVLR